MELLLTAAYRALPMMPEEIREKVAALITPQALATIAGVATIWGASHLIGIGFVADIVFAGVSVVMIGWDVVQALRGYAHFYRLAVNARGEKDINDAAHQFASATITLVNTIGWARLGQLLGRSAGRTVKWNQSANSIAKLERWKKFIDSLEFKIPRDRGMLWSSLGNPRVAKEIAEKKGLISLEMLLGKNGFEALYATEFGKTQNSVTKEIWTLVSQKYARSLEGKVTGYVHRASHYAKINKAADPKLINPTDPVLVHEVDEISKILLGNNKITEVLLIDVQTGEAFGYRTKEILESLQRLAKKPTVFPYIPYEPGRE